METRVRVAPGSGRRMKWDLTAYAIPSAPARNVPAYPIVMVTTWVASQKLESRTARIISMVSPSPVRWCATISEVNPDAAATPRSEEHTSELQSRPHLVCRLLLEKKK